MSETSNMTTAFLSTYELGKYVGNEEGRKAVFNAAEQCAMTNETGKYVYLEDLKQYLDWHDNEQKN